MNSKDIVQDRLANITQEQQKLRGMQDQAVAARDQALAQLAQYRDLELRLNGAATVLQEVLGAISIQEANQAAQEQAAKDQAALVAVQDKVLEIVRGIKKSKNNPAGMSSRLDLDLLGMLELALRLEDAFGIDVDAGEDDDDHDDDGQDGNDLKKVTDAETINDVVEFVRRLKK